MAEVIEDDGCGLQKLAAESQRLTAIADAFDSSREHGGVWLQQLAETLTTRVKAVLLEARQLPKLGGQLELLACSLSSCIDALETPTNGADQANIPAAEKSKIELERINAQLLAHIRELERLEAKSVVYAKAHEEHQHMRSGGDESFQAFKLAVVELENRTLQMELKECKQKQSDNIQANDAAALVKKKNDAAALARLEREKQEAVVALARLEREKEEAVVALARLEREKEEAVSKTKSLLEMTRQFEKEALDVKARVNLLEEETVVSLSSKQRMQELEVTNADIMERLASSEEREQELKRMNADLIERFSSSQQRGQELERTSADLMELCLLSEQRRDELEQSNLDLLKRINALETNQGRASTERDEQYEEFLQQQVTATLESQLQQQADNALNVLKNALKKSSSGSLLQHNQVVEAELQSAYSPKSPMRAVVYESPVKSSRPRVPTTDGFAPTPIAPTLNPQAQSLQPPVPISYGSVKLAIGGSVVQGSKSPQTPWPSVPTSEVPVIRASSVVNPKSAIIRKPSQTLSCPTSPYQLSPRREIRPGTGRGSMRVPVAQQSPRRNTKRET